MRFCYFATAVLVFFSSPTRARNGRKPNPTLATDRTKARRMTFESW
jgi:hypothetical protein